MLESGTFS